MNTGTLRQNRRRGEEAGLGGLGGAFFGMNALPSSIRAVFSLGEQGQINIRDIRSYR